MMSMLMMLNQLWFVEMHETKNDGVTGTYWSVGYRLHGFFLGILILFAVFFYFLFFRNLCNNLSNTCGYYYLNHPGNLPGWGLGFRVNPKTLAFLPPSH